MIFRLISLLVPYQIYNHVSFHFQRVDPELVFTKQERIGKGSFGEVYKVSDIATLFDR